MAIRITEINAKNIGPVREFRMQPADLNLVYGRNERGKTGLVEFILKCLFKTGPRSPGGWQLRGLGGTGRITVTGLPGGERTFSTSKEKLDDIWAESDREMPENISRLLVVRGAEPALADDCPGGAGKEILSKLLSNEDVLAPIQDSIPRNIVKAEITAEEITGPAQGQVQQYREYRERVKQVGRLMDEAMDARSAGNREGLRARADELRTAIGRQDRAWRHRAFALKQQMDGLDAEIGSLPDEDIARLRRDIDSYIEKQAALARRNPDLASARGTLENYEWLRHCRERYSDYIRATVEPPGPGLLVACAVALVGVVICVALKWSLVAILLLGVLVALGWLHMRAIRESAAAGVGERCELAKMAAEYEVRFGESLTGAPQLDQKFEMLSREQGRAAELEVGIRTLEDECAALRDGIIRVFHRLVGEDVPVARWAEQARQLKVNREALERTRGAALEQFARLNIAPDQMLEEDPGTPFDPDELDRRSSELAEMEAALARDEQRLANVKEAIARETGTSVSESFETLLQALTEKQNRAVQVCREVAAGIIAGKVVYDVVEVFRAEEDRTIREGMACEAVTDCLRAVTGEYTEISLENDSLRVSGPASEYDFAGLSTGTQEQVMLSLRMGFAMRIAGGDPMFLVLDDAFQHSDWQRREQLVARAVSLVDKGWQVFYLTMDDHLRDLFRAHGAGLVPGRFVEASL